MKLPLRVLRTTNDPLFDEPCVEVDNEGLQVSRVDNSIFVSSKSIASAPEIETRTYDVYNKAFARAFALGFPHPVRIWNVIPQINSFYNGRENYQHFCAGRLRSYKMQNLHDFVYPAASAIGSKDSTLYFGFLFSREPGSVVSNPHQMEAFRYPRQYGPVSPSFTRAMIHSNRLYISGTASIRGHESLHSEDCFLQLELTIANLRAVVHEAQRVNSNSFPLERAAIRVFIRNCNAVHEIETRLCGNGFERIELLEADICRKELLLEIEGVIDAV